MPRIAFGVLLALSLVACAGMPLTADARKVKVLKKTGANVNEVYRVKAECQLIGEMASDDRNELLNEGASKGADTIILSKGPMFRPDHAAEFYRCKKGG